MMAEMVRLIPAYLAWRVTGSKAAGGLLLDALASEDEDSRMLTCMMIVRAKYRGRALLRDAIDHERSLPTALTMLADIGDARDEYVLKRFVEYPDAQVSLAARDALRVLQHHSVAGPLG